MRTPPARGRVLRVAVLLGVALAAGGGGAPAFLLGTRAAWAADDEFATAHVRAKGDVGAERLAEFTRLGEAGWPHWKAYFGTEPKGDRLPMRMDVRKDRDGFLAAVRAAGVTGEMPGAGGYYDPRTRTSFLYLQPHVSSSRLLVLHELTHQFQYLALQDNVPDRSPTWHAEGLAEHFGFHRRTGAAVEVGALDMVAIDDRPAECAKRVADGAFSAWKVGTGATAPDYTDAMTLLETFLRTKDEGLARVYRQWEREIYRAGNAHKRFERLFASQRERLEAAVKEVWGGVRRPWHVAYVAWDEKDGVIEGRGSPWAFLEGTERLEPSRRSIAAQIQLTEEAAAAGLALCATGPERCLVAEVRPPSRVSIRRRRDAAWTELASKDLERPFGGGPLSVRFRIEGDEAIVEVEGAEVVRANLAEAGLPADERAGTAGLVAESGAVGFARVRVGP